MKTRYRLAATGLALTMLSACGGSRDEPRYEVDIRRTSFGIPHIKADDEGSLGYGIGYAYAQDNFCTMAEHLVTLDGQRALHFGPGETDTDNGLTQPGNVASDYFHRLLNDGAAVRTAWQAYSTPVRSLLTGFAAGYNRYLEETGAARLPAACRDQPWVRKMTDQDLTRLMRSYGVLNGMGALGEFIAEAQPPSNGEASAVRPDVLKRVAARSSASNALALGRNASDNGRGVLLGNPHFPWHGVLRMYQLHLTIPGKLDVMGATLPGVPLVGIGFTREFAWTHTTSTGARSTLYKLALDPSDPTRYLVDGVSRPMTRRTVAIQVRQPGGPVRTQQRTFFASEHGPVLEVPPLGLQWTRGEAWAIRDVNEHNHRMVEQWYAMNLAKTLPELKDAVLRVLGNPWNNTVAADREGRTLFMGATPVPHVTAEQFADCLPEGGEVLLPLELFALDGSRSACDWGDDPAAPQRGILPASALPVLERDDYVHNANASAWLTNPAMPLAGYSPLASIDGTPQNLRTRFALQQVQARLAGTDGQPGRRMSAEQVAHMVFGNRVPWADLVLDDLLQLCPGGPHATPPSAELLQACEHLRAWDRTAELDAGIGYGYFEAWVQQLYQQEAVDGLWAVPFDPADPVHTPRGLRVSDAQAAATARSALEAAVRQVAAAGWTPGQRWGDVQGAQRGERHVPVHGGSDGLGVYNAIESTWTDAGRREVTDGTSYLQLVSFDDQGPRARALLAYSQSTDPASPHAADQTERFMRKEWVTLPFTDAQIRADPALKHWHLAQ
nr:penicillin acylase family protein [uncultured Caldimonas sp.]